MKTDGRAQKKIFQISQKSSTTLSQLRRTQSVFLQENTNFIYQKIRLPSETLNDQLAIYNWRNSIQKGIVKCIWTCIFPLSKNELVIETKRKYFPLNLEIFGKMSLSQLLYILREVLQGYQILYSKFGGFKVQKQMINFNEQFEVQVWGCKELNSNNFQLNDMNEHNFVCSVLRLLQTHQIKTNLIGQFYQGLLRFDLLNFKIVRNYVENFTKINQLIIPSNNFIKQAFFTLDRKKKILFTKSKTYEKRYFTKKVLSPRKSDFDSYQSSKDFNLIFSPSKKNQRKRINGLKINSDNFLKDSDITTQEGEHENKNTLKKYITNSQIEQRRRSESQISYNLKQKNTFCLNVISPQIIHSKEQLQVRKEPSEQLIQLKKLKTQSSMQNLLQTPTFQKILQKNQKINIENSQDQKWNNYDCRMTNSIIHKLELQINRFDQDPQIKNQQSQSKGQKHDKFQGQHKFLQFRKPKIIFSFFNCIDDLAESKQMNNSIKIGPQIRKQSSVNLEKLGKFKLKMHQSIITEQNFFPSTQQ